jgi:hypothetical protein
MFGILYYINIMLWRLFGILMSDGYSIPIFWVLRRIIIKNYNLFIM